MLHVKNNISLIEMILPKYKLHWNAIFVLEFQLSSLGNIIKSVRKFSLKTI